MTDQEIADHYGIDLSLPAVQLYMPWIRQLYYFARAREA